MTFYIAYANEDSTCSYNDLIVKRMKAHPVALKIIDLVITIKPFRDLVPNTIDLVE